LTNSGDTFFTRGMIIPLDGDASVITFQWNPKSVMQDKSIKWQHLAVAGREQPFQQYGCGQPHKYVFPFTVSRSNNGPDFVKWVQDELLKLTKPTAGGTVKRPPLCQVILGTYLNIKCIVTDVRFQSEEFFDPINLLPTSCEAVISVERYLDME
jgi:hypothetical protein